jgi:class 3 adenylate cyclase
MTKKRQKRRLVALVHADVKGYTRLMESDETSTIEVITLCQDGMKSLAQQHAGKVVDTAGDGFLLEFISAEDAVRFALDFQKAVTGQNWNVPEHLQMNFRIGVHFGNVTAVGNKIYGHAVNIAARLEGLAAPGGICISGTVYDVVKKKLPLHYEHLAGQLLKNIIKPVSVYRIHRKSLSTESKDSATQSIANGRKVLVPEIPLPKLEKEFSDKDRNTFLRDSFAAIVVYFKRGLKSLEKQYPAIATRFEEVTRQKYTFEIDARSGLKNACKIWIHKPGSEEKISYGYGDFQGADDSSRNEWIHTEDDGFTMYLTGLVGEFGANLSGGHLTTQDAARILWERFTLSPRASWQLPLLRISAF